MWQIQVANLAVKKMKKVEEEHKGILVQLKEAKCKVEGLKGELVEAYSKIKFLELEIIQTNVKVKRISTKKLDNVLSSQKSSHDKTSLGYTGEGSSSSEPKKEIRFVSAKNDEKIKEVKLEAETPAAVKRTFGAKPKEKGKSLPKNQKGPQGHIRLNCFKLHALKMANSLRGQETSRRRPMGVQAKGDNEGHLIGDVMEMLKNISLCLASFTPKFESYVGRTPPSKALTQNTRKVWVQKGTYA